MDGNKDRKDDTAETSEDVGFNRMMNGVTALREHQKALDAILSAKKEVDANLREQVAHVKSQALQVVEAAIAVLDRLSLVDSSEFQVPRQLYACRHPKEASNPLSRFASGTQRVVTLMQQMSAMSQPSGDITLGIRYAWTAILYAPSGYSDVNTYNSHAFTAWGYLVGIRAMLDCEKMGVHLVLHPGPNDSFLSWPFKKTFTFTLVHPTDGSLDVHYRCVPLDTTDATGPFQRPSNKANAGCGTNNLCTIAFIRKNGFLADDHLGISVEILK